LCVEQCNRSTSVVISEVIPRPHKTDKENLLLSQPESGQKNKFFML